MLIPLKKRKDILTVANAAMVLKRMMINYPNSSSPTSPKRRPDIATAKTPSVLSFTANAWLMESIVMIDVIAAIATITPKKKMSEPMLFLSSWKRNPKSWKVKASRNKTEAKSSEEKDATAKSLLASKNTANVITLGLAVALIVNVKAVKIPMPESTILTLQSMKKQIIHLLALLRI